VDCRPKVFFVATGPLSGDGHINCSPKDGYSIRVLDRKTLVYLDLIGSGVETIAHVRENGRIIVMMCAFEGAPKIMRFHGRGEVIEKDNSQFEHLKTLFGSEVGIRSFILIHLDRISDSCGFGVPVLEFKDYRKHLRAYNERIGEEKLADYLQCCLRVDDEDRASETAMPGPRGLGRQMSLQGPVARNRRYQNLASSEKLKARKSASGTRGYSNR